MTLPLFIVRPEPGLSASVAAARALGLEVFAEPLVAIERCSWRGPEPETVDGLLLGSANAILDGGPELERYKDKPVYAVGEATAAAARAAGFVVAGAGSSGLQPLLDSLAGQRLTLLRPSGQARVALSPPAGVKLVTRIAYAGVPRPMSEEFADRLRDGGVAAIHSGAIARHFAGECRRYAIDRSGLALATMALRVAAGTGAGWAAVRWAPEPTDAALLALANDMCHGGAASSQRG